MKTEFKSYFAPSGDEFIAMWKESLFCFDASVLLNVYGYSQETREELLSLLERLAVRTRLPHQFGLEFARDRVKVILKQVANYHSVERELAKIKQVNFAPRREHPFLSPESLKSYETLSSELANDRKQMEELITIDPYADRICAIFEGRLGKAPTDEELTELHEQARIRYAKKIPPGYEDLKEKGEPQAYGDYIGWSQVIDIGKQEQKGVIFVCDDAKEDWWHIEKERTIGPRYEIIQEFLTNVKRPFHMYSSDSFLRFAKQYLDEKIRENSIIEISQRLASQTETLRAISLKPSPAPNESEAGGLKPTAIEPEPVKSEARIPAPMEDTDLKPEAETETE